MRKAEFSLNLNNIDKVSQFSQIAQGYKYDVTVLSGRYVIDGKSIMGLFSLNLSKEVTVEIKYEKEAELNRVLEQFLDVGITLTSK